MMESHSCLNLSHFLIISVTQERAGTFYYHGELTEDHFFADALFNT